MNQSLIYHSPFSQKQNKIVKKVLNPNALNFAANLFSHRYSILQANSSETPPVDCLPKNALIKDRLHRHRHPLNNKINLNLRTWHQLKCCKCLVPLTDTVFVLLFLFHFLSIVFFYTVLCRLLMSVFSVRVSNCFHFQAPADLRYPDPVISLKRLYLYQDKNIWDFVRGELPDRRFIIYYQIHMEVFIFLTLRPRQKLITDCTKHLKNCRHYCSNFFNLQPSRISECFHRSLSFHF